MANEKVVGMQGTDHQVDPVPRSMAAAAGAKAAAEMDAIWADDSSTGDGSTQAVDQGGGGDGSEPAPAPVATPVPAPAATPAPVPVTAPTDLVTKTGLPAEILAAKTGTPVKAGEPAVHPVVDEAAEDAKAQQTIAALPEKAQKEAFIDLRRQLKEERNRRKEFETKIATTAKELETVRTQTGQSTAEALATVTKELADAKTQLESMEAQVGKTNYAQSKEYREKFDLPAQAVIMKMARLVETVGGRTKEEAAQIANSLVKAAPAERISLLGEENPAVQGALLSAASDYDTYTENGRIALDNWKAQKAVVDEEQRRQQQTALVKNLFEDTEKAVNALTAEGNVLFTRAQDPNWNKAVDERIAAVRGILQSGDTSLLIKHIADGVSAPKWREMYWSMLNEYSQLKAQAEKAIGVVPGVGGGDGTAPDAGSPVKTVPKSSKEAFDIIWGPDSR